MRGGEEYEHQRKQQGPHFRGRRHSADSFSTGQACALCRCDDGIGRLLAALDKHADHAGVVEQACGAVRNLASKNADNKVLIAKEGGIPLTLAALDNHAEHAGVVEQACGAVWNLAANAENKVLIAEAGGIRRLLAALDNHAEHAGVVRSMLGWWRGRVGR